MCVAVDVHVCAWGHISHTHTAASVAEWLRAWDTSTMFEATTLCGRSRVQSPTGAI